MFTPRPWRCPSPAAPARRTAATWRASPRGVIACASRWPARVRSGQSTTARTRRLPRGLGHDRRVRSCPTERDRPAGERRTTADQIPRVVRRPAVLGAARPGLQSYPVAAWGTAVARYGRVSVIVGSASGGVAGAVMIYEAALGFGISLGPLDRKLASDGLLVGDEAQSRERPGRPQHRPRDGGSWIA